MKKTIPFSPPDITEKEIESVISVLRSGWITTGPKTIEFENKIKQYINCSGTVCVSSATSGLFLVLKYLGINKNTEVITTPYTYCATANVIRHCQAKPVFADIKDNSFEIDPDKINPLINKKTKVVMPVDFAGIPSDHNGILEILKTKDVTHRSDFFEKFKDRPILVTDSAHSFGSVRNSIITGAQPDFSVFSFHAVKNLITAEGGAICFPENKHFNTEKLIKTLKTLSLHGQSKDALSKFKDGQWKYDVLYSGYKCNLTDIQSALGIIQLERYDEFLKIRLNICKLYNKFFNNSEKFIVPAHFSPNYSSSCHIYPLRIKNISEEQRDSIIKQMQVKGISVNVHFVPLPLLSAYKKDYNINDYPNTLKRYREEITLPVYTNLSENNVEFICTTLIKILKKIK